MVVFQTSFRGYNAASDFFNGGASSPFGTTINQTAGWDGGPALPIFDNGYAYHIPHTPDSMMILAFRFKFSAFGQGPICTFYGDTGDNSNGNRIISVTIDTLGAISLFKGWRTYDNSWRAAKSANGLISPGEWHHIQVKLTVTGFSDGGNTISYDCIIKLNDVEIINCSDTTALYDGVGIINKLGPFWVVGGTTCFYGDLYIVDSQGTDNDFLGDLAGIAVFPIGVGATSNFAPSVATDNWQLVDDTLPDEDSTFVSSDTVGDLDTYEYPDIVLPSGSEIISIQNNIYAKKDNAGSRSIAGACRSGGTNYIGLDDHPTDGVGVSLGNSYRYEKQNLNMDPATGVHWTQSGYNAAEFGEKVTA